MARIGLLDCVDGSSWLQKADRDPTWSVSLTSFDLPSGAPLVNSRRLFSPGAGLRFQITAARFFVSCDFLFLFSNSGGRLSLGSVCCWPTNRSFGDLRAQKIALVRQPPGGNSRGHDRPRRHAQRVSQSQTPAYVSGPRQRIVTGGLRRRDPAG